MKKVLVLVLALVSCGKEIVAPTATPTPTPVVAPLGGVPMSRRSEDKCSVAKEIMALSRQAVSSEKIFRQCLELARKNEPSCHELCNP